MKKTLLALSSMLFATMAAAHPAMDVSVNADYNGKTAEIVYKHTVNGAAKHYIDEIKVKLNGKLIITQILSMQENEKGGSVKYLIPELKRGDVLEVDTHCNKGGSKSGKSNSEKLEIKQSKATEK